MEFASSSIIGECLSFLDLSELLKIAPLLSRRWHHEWSLLKNLKNFWRRRQYFKDWHNQYADFSFQWIHLRKLSLQTIEGLCKMKHLRSVAVDEILFSPTISLLKKVQRSCSAIEHWRVSVYYNNETLRSLANLPVTVLHISLMFKMIEPCVALPSVRDLAISNGTNIPFSDVFRSLLPGFSGLRTVTISNYTGRDGMDWKALQENTGTLRELHLQHCSIPYSSSVAVNRWSLSALILRNVKGSWDWLQHMAFPNLYRLSIKDCMQLTDSDLNFKAFPNLGCLVIVGPNRLVTGQFLQHLHSLVRLKSLFIGSRYFQGEHAKWFHGLRLTALAIFESHEHWTWSAVDSFPILPELRNLALINEDEDWICDKLSTSQLPKLHSLCIHSKKKLNRQKILSRLNQIRELILCARE